jgi:hypothetical protein
MVFGGGTGAATAGDTFDDAWGGAKHAFKP